MKANYKNLLVHSGKDVAESSIGSEVKKAPGRKPCKRWLGNILAKSVLLELDKLSDGGRKALGRWRLGLDVLSATTKMILRKTVQDAAS